jgi:hypothetical protein
VREGLGPGHRRQKTRAFVEGVPRDRIYEGDFFGKWQMLFGICREVFREETKLLSTIAITNWYIRDHPLRQLNKASVGESSGDQPGEVRELARSPVIASKPHHQHCRIMAVCNPCRPSNDSFWAHLVGSMR